MKSAISASHNSVSNPNTRRRVGPRGFAQLRRSGCTVAIPAKIANLGLKKQAAICLENARIKPFSSSQVARRAMPVSPDNGPGRERANRMARGSVWIRCVALTNPHERGVAYGEKCRSAIRPRKSASQLEFAPIRAADGFQNAWAFPITNPVRPPHLLDSALVLDSQVTRTVHQRSGESSMAGGVSVHLCRCLSCHCCYAEGAEMPHAPPEGCLTGSVANARGAIW